MSDMSDTCLCGSNRTRRRTLTKSEIARVESYPERDAATIEIRECADCKREVFVGKAQPT